ncbi:MAG: hypothetical protein IEMM0001_1998 [bacterium]|nr:MAG: hypothetical protein IEMM0001_1998 [bacterium]
MKLLFFLLTLSLSMAAMADTVKKWIDTNGNVHYGDKKAAEYVKGTETLKIRDTYDQQSYDEGVERHKENKIIGDKLEKERIAEEEKREAKEDKPVSHAPSSGRTTILHPPVRRAEPYHNRPSGLGNGTRPVQLPAKRN